MTRSPLRPLLRVLPAAIAALWVVGVARFRGHELTLMQLLALVAAALAIQIVLQRWRGQPRPINLPANASIPRIALLAALLVGLFAALGGGAIEALAPPGDAATTTPYWLRVCWHCACAFAAAYCRFLLQLQPRAAPADP